MSAATATMTEPESGKRKASAAGLPAHNRPVKRRASKACCCCRARKVRCDVVENGSPCTNCRLDQVECIVTASKRRKFVHTTEEHTDPAMNPVFANRELFAARRKSRVEVEHAQHSESPGEASEENPLQGRPGDAQGIPDMAPTSPSQNSVEVDHGQHMPHLLCTYSRLEGK